MSPSIYEFKEKPSCLMGLSGVQDVDTGEKSLNIDSVILFLQCAINHSLGNSLQ